MMLHEIKDFYINPKMVVLLTGAHEIRMRMKLHVENTKRIVLKENL